MISAGEVHLPGRPKDIVGLKALAIVAVRAFANVRPAGVKVHAGAPILEAGARGAGLRRPAPRPVSTSSVRVGLGSVKTGRRRGPDAGLGAAARHGVDVPHRRAVDRRVERDPRGRRAGEAAPDIVGHGQRRRRPAPDDDIEQLVASGTWRHRDRPLREAARAALHAIGPGRAKTGALGRVILGNDAPSGTGVVPLGSCAPWRTSRRWAASRPEEAVCSGHRQHRTGPPPRRPARSAIGPRGGPSRWSTPRRGSVAGDRPRRPRHRRPARRRDDPDRRQAGDRPQPQHPAGGGAPEVVKGRGSRGGGH